MTTRLQRQLEDRLARKVSTEEYDRFMREYFDGKKRFSDLLDEWALREKRVREVFGE